MVSLSKLCRITEEGVEFESPYDGTVCLLTPERSIAIQQAIGETSSILISFIHSVWLNNHALTLKIAPATIILVKFLFLGLTVFFK